MVPVHGDENSVEYHAEQQLIECTNFYSVAVCVWELILGVVGVSNHSSCPR
jgi:hypothetical protein